MYERFKNLLDVKGLRPADIANALGFNKALFSDWKSGKSKPNAEKLVKIAKYLGCSVEYLVTGEDEPGKEYYLNDETAQIAQAIFDNRDLRILFDTARDSTADDLKTATTMLSALKAKERG